MNRSIRKSIAIMLAFVLLVSGINSSMLSAAEENTTNEETATTYLEQNTTDQEESVTEEKTENQTADTGIIPEEESTTKKDYTQEIETPKMVLKNEFLRTLSATADAVGRHEAEDAESFTQGSASNTHSVEQDSAFSGGKAVGNMNTWPNDGRAYFTYSVNANNAGDYTLKIAYATSNANETNIDVRINGGSWSSVKAPSTGAYNTVKTVSMTVTLQGGTNTIDITGASNVWYETGYEWQWANIDYFELEYLSAVDVEGRHEAENANSFTQTTSSGTHTISEDSAFSGGKAVGNMNVWPDDGRAFFTYRVNASRAGKYKLTIAYAADNDSTEKKDCNIDIRINGTTENDWKSLTAPLTGSYNTVKTITTTVTLKKGTNIVDVTGASNVWYGEPHNWQWTNIDYIEFANAPMAEGRHEAEEAKTFTQGSADNEHSIVEDSGFSGGQAVGKMDTWPDAGRSYLTYPVNVEKSGTYTLKVGYATENSKDTHIDVRINSDSNDAWKSITAPGTSGWNSVGTASITVTLKKGINNIDITGASNVWYEDPHVWQWANIDYFELTRITDSTNIALDKPVTTSGNRSDQSGSGYGSNTPEEAVDGYSDSRWGGLGNQSENWFMIDLQGMYEIESVKLVFEQAYAKDFEIQVSRDGVNWITSRTVKDWTPSGTIAGDSKLEWNSNSVCLGKAKYIRLYATKLNNSTWGMSIWEFEVRGEKVSPYLSDVLLNKTATTSSSNENKAQNAIDGKDDTRWGSQNGDTQWYQVALGKEYELHSVDLKFERAYAQNFKVQTSEDGTNWTDVRTESGWNEPGTPNTLGDDKKIGYSFHLDSVKASYIRIEATGLTGDGTWNGLSIYEFEAWGKDLDKSSYWEGQDDKTYGIYPVDGLYDSERESQKINATLVQNEVLGTGDTYEVVYEANKSIYFYVNPYNTYINYTADAGKDNDTVCWSSSDSGTGLWGADYHSEAIADYTTQRQATVQYKLPSGLNFGDSDYVITEIGCQVYGTTEGVSDIKDGKPVEGKTPKFSTKIKIKVIKASGVTIEDTIEENGSIKVKNPDSGAAYEWERSSDGSSNWEAVAEKREDLTVLYDSGQRVNVAMDQGGGMYYRVRKQGSSEWSNPYKITYYNNVQNGDFENPAMSTPVGAGGDVNVHTSDFPFGTQQGDEQQYPNGYSGLFWKTTGPGWNGKVGHDIEIVNGRRLKTTAASSQENEFSVTLEGMYKNNEHGDQFAELNCENIGALYQDILTTPDSECYWNLDHAGRWNQNTMYVVAMSTKDAKSYATPEELESLINKAKSNISQDTKSAYYAGDKIDLGSGVYATIWKVTSPALAGEWEHHSGKYKVPNSGQDYLTRFFFVSAEGGKRKRNDTENRTVGNLLDNITFEMKKSYTVKYYVDDESTEKYTTQGIVEPYDRIKVPQTINGYDLSKYTLYKVMLNGKSYYLDEATRLMTVAYEHDDLQLYYKSSTIAVTKKIKGLSEIPDGYQIRFDLIKGGGSIASQTLDKSKFTKIEDAGSSGEQGYFVTIEFDGTSLGLAEGDGCTVTETVVPIINSYYLSQVQVNSDTNNLSISNINKNEIKYSDSFTYYTQQANSSTFTNIYKPTHKLTVKKEVKGNIGNLTKKFDFTLNLQQSGSDIDVISYDNQNVDMSKTGTGNYSFKLKNTDSVTFTVSDDCIATVKETDYSLDGYTTSYDVPDINTNSITAGGNGFVTSESISKDVTATFTNTKIAPAATGLLDNARPFIILICCAILALLCFMAGRKGWFAKIHGALKR